MLSASVANARAVIGNLDSRPASQSRRPNWRCSAAADALAGGKSALMRSASA